jgi:hypothetical protein
MYHPFMKRFFATSLILLVEATSLAAYADDSIPPIPPGEDKIVPIKKGEPAPFDGELFDPPTAVRWGNWLLMYKQRLKLDVTFEQRLHSADNELWKKKLEIEHEKYMTVVPNLELRIQDLERQLANPPFWKTTWFGFAVGIVVTGAIVGVTAYGIHSTR